MVEKTLNIISIASISVFQFTLILPMTVIVSELASRWCREPERLVDIAEVAEVADTATVVT